MICIIRWQTRFLKGTFVNRKYLFINGGSFEILSAVPLKMKFHCFFPCRLRKLMILGGLDEKEGKEGKREEFIRMEGGSCRSDDQERKECAGCGNKIHDKFLLKVRYG